MLALSPTPLIAILRGIEPEECAAVTAALVDAGFGAIEVPLNSPDPCKSIAGLAARYGGRVLIGAGTVLSADEAERVADAGARLAVAPNFDAAVVARAAELGLAVLPGVATPTEAFAALKAGASALKMFPAEGLPPEILRAWRSVLPPATQLFPVGGITPERVGPYRKAGAAGFGLGGALYRPGMTAAEVALRASAFVGAWRENEPGPDAPASP